MSAQPTMKYVCKHCGRVHEEGYECPKKPKVESKYEKPKELKRFHSSTQWTKKALRIKSRDDYLCQACRHELDKTIKHFTSDDLEVHHIVKAKDDKSLRLDDLNLITLCPYHHHMADSGQIDAEILKKIAEENQKNKIDDTPSIIF